MLTGNSKKEIVIMGGGLAGLSAAVGLSRAGQPVVVFESAQRVGGLSRTIRHGDFKFDLGGHRFFTKNLDTDQFVKDILKGDYVTVNRKSKIYMHRKFFDYPLKPANALLGLGIPVTIRAISDYGKEKIRNSFREKKCISLEDWVVAHFGRTMFNIYFKDYSEKVWGIECHRISEAWVSKRIEGLSLGVALKNALFKFSGRKVPTLVDKFIYPPAGIGQIPEMMREEIEKENTVHVNTRITEIRHRDFVVSNLTARNCGAAYEVAGDEFVSSIPLNHLVAMMNPSPPDDIIDAASKLRYRDLVIVTVMLNREKVTDLTWLYLPEKDMPLGRIHEPKNWSPGMAPAGKTHIVAEYFCFQNEKTWNSSDEELTVLTAKNLEKLGLIRKSEVTDSCVVRVPKAYPVFEVGYHEHYQKVLNYLRNFRNLHIAGRTGLFKYYNIDHAIESGREVAEKIISHISQQH